MLLTSEMLTDLVSSLRANAPTGVEKRQEPRVGMRLRVDVFLPGQLQPLQVWVRDIGAGGIGILCDESVEIGAEFKLSLTTRASAPELLTCVVRHCRRTGGGQYFVGAEFSGRFASKNSK